MADKKENTRDLTSAGEEFEARREAAPPAGGSQAEADLLTLPATPVEPATFALREYALWQLMRTEAYGHVWRPVIHDVRDVTPRRLRPIMGSTMPEFFDAPKKKGGRPTNEAPIPPAQDAGPREAVSVPPMTADRAAELAAFLHAGMSAADALIYLLPGVDPDTLDRTAIRWSRHPLVLEAVATLHGGAWPHLDDETRIGVALRKHRIECAHFLMTHRLDEATGAEIGKIEMARKVLEAFTAGGLDPSDPLTAFARAAKEIMAASLGPTPAQQAGGVYDYREPAGLDPPRDLDPSVSDCKSARECSADFDAVRHGEAADHEKGEI